MSEFHSHDDVDRNDSDYFVQFEVVCYVELLNPDVNITGNMLLQTLVTRELLASGVAQNSVVTALQFPAYGENKGYILFTVQSPLMDVADIYKKFNKAANREIVEGTEAGESLRSIPIYFEQEIVGRLKEIAPNWFVGSAYHIGLGAHGPGGPPRPVVNPKMLQGLRFDYDQPFGLPAASISEEDCDDVVVYILDTIPDRCRIKSATSRWPLLKAPFRHILDETPGTTRANIYETGRATYHYANDVGSDLSRIYTYEHRLHELQIGASSLLLTNKLIDHPYAVGEHHYDSSDHGLFIAGIVHMIAPRVKIHVLEVIGFNGVGTFTSYAAGYLKVIELHREHQKTHPSARAIINSSFTLAIPIGDHQDTGIDHMAASAVSGKQPQVKDISDYEKQFPLIAPQMEALMLALDTSVKQIDALVIAAAGNDSDRTTGATTGKEARYPAQFETVIGVGALKKDRVTAARYSNKPDQPPIDGYMVFGGDYDEDAKPLKETGDYGDTGCGVIGVFTGNLNVDIHPHNTAKIPPFDPNLFVNPYGFAEWKGTSFAAPILTGTIAQLCCATGIMISEAREIVRTASNVVGNIREFTLVKQVQGKT